VVIRQHEYEDNQKVFDKDVTVMNTCNQFNPAQFNPDKFQPVELPDEEIIYTYDVKWERSDTP
jgi:hypothetical protein